MGRVKTWIWGLSLVGLGALAYWFFLGRACTDFTTEAAMVRASFFREDTVPPGYRLTVPIKMRCSGFGRIATLWQIEGQTVSADAENLRLEATGFSQEGLEKGVYAVDLTLAPVNPDQVGSVQQLNIHFVNSNGYFKERLDEQNMTWSHSGHDIVVPVDVRIIYDPRRVTPLPQVSGGPVVTTESEAHRLRVSQWYQFTLDAPLTVTGLAMTTPGIENVRAGWTTEADPSSDSLWYIRDSLTKATPIVPTETTTLPSGPVVLFVNYDVPLQTTSDAYILAGETVLETPDGLYSLVPETSRFGSTAF